MMCDGHVGDVLPVCPQKSRATTRLALRRIRVFDQDRVHRDGEYDTFITGLEPTLPTRYLGT